MGHYDASTQKPQKGWTNCKNFAHLDKGKWSRKAAPKPSVQTVKKTVSKSGRAGYCGTKDLKATQF